jgi:hypothetical protein
MYSFAIFIDSVSKLKCKSIALWFINERRLGHGS